MSLSLTSPVALMDRFVAIVGRAHVLHDPADLVRYNADGRQATGMAGMVLRPGSTAEVSALMRLAAQERLTLVPQGARTGLVGAGLAGAGRDAERIILSLDRLARSPVVDPLNRSMEVDAGVLLSTVNAAAGEHGLVFPIDLGADPSVGGMVATNTGGARLLRYGDVRRNLLGVEAVLADGAGTVVTLGRGVWKDNSGLDLKHLLAGAAGSLGIVTRATLALQPRPTGAVTAMLALDEPESALSLLLELEATFGTLLTAFEGMSRAALTAAFAHVPRLRHPFAGETPAYAVLVEVSAGPVMGEAALEEALGAALLPHMAGNAATIRDVAIDRRDDLWAIRHAIPEGLRSAGKVVGCDIALRRGDVMRFRQDVAARLAAIAPQLVLHDFGHIGDGGLHFNLVWPHAAGPFDAAVAEQGRAAVFAATVEDYGGSFSAEHGIGPVNQAYYARFVPVVERRLAGAIQALLAPQTLGRVDFGSGETA